MGTLLMEALDFKKLRVTRTYDQLPCKLTRTYGQLPYKLTRTYGLLPCKLTRTSATELPSQEAAVADSLFDGADEGVHDGRFFLTRTRDLCI